ncbi:MAG: 2-dehydropantoate 2-reductase [Candidatus Omnitrophica bacterium CG11_big_fil_rev_8_21_14_0_20_45_26]|uniref:2-dehydropantoate 2-reductase n=1 Tax=Candidatus Abzuiibacterium crystallinum TaxID=1974748 RepID=A0A2H0LML7_9BACT|nr:MAG: 2-dehydropantoate 2-reductase [Candidatus Omnitrophica bacterium CG11_big_fil_rev_8_21_14_0_20_45_26]PIW65196.1 MAG: 2-dehydropantoate 2-reductase [Candidatus Omnitrophica bacterium CG12_big_fil_rev_8_21_14_0_65_45_16]
MTILVFGSGAIGSAFGGFLLRAGHRVILYGRARHLSRVKKHGLRVSGIWGRHCFKGLQVVTNLAGLKQLNIRYDLMLLTVKAFDTFQAARQAKSVIQAKTLVCSLQNGLGNIEALHRVFPKRQVIAGRVIFGVELHPGEIKITVWGGDVLVGETAMKRLTSRVKQLAVLFSKAGIRSQAVSDIRQHIWGKVIYNCALNPLASLLHVHYGALLEKPMTRDMMKQVVQECYAVAKKGRLNLKPRKAADYERLLFRRLIPDTYYHHPSMLFDLERNRPTEIEALNGAICHLGKRRRVPTPMNGLIYNLMRTASCRG